MPAHGVAGDALTLHIEGEIFAQQGGQLLGQIIPHLVVRRPRVLDRVHIEPRAFAKVVSVIIGHSFATRGGVGEDQRDAVFRGPSLRARLGHGVLMGAGQA